MTSLVLFANLSNPLSVTAPGLSFLASPGGKSGTAAPDPAVLELVARAAAVLGEAS